MKTLKLILILTLVALCIEQLKAQDARMGIKVGANFSNLFIDNEDLDDENMRVGFHGGVYGQFLGEDNLVGFQTELLYSNKGATGEYSGGLFGTDQKYSFNLNYIDIPLLAVFKLGEFVELQAGGYVGLLLNSSITTEGDLGDDYEELDRDNFNSVDYGLSGGIAVNLDMVTFGARYNYGLNEIARSDEAEAVLGDAKNSVAQIYIGLNLVR